MLLRYIDTVLCCCWANLPNITCAYEENKSFLFKININKYRREEEQWYWNIRHVHKPLSAWKYGSLRNSATVMIFDNYTSGVSKINYPPPKKKNRKLSAIFGNSDWAVCEKKMNFSIVAVVCYKKMGKGNGRKKPSRRIPKPTNRRIVKIINVST